MISLYEIAPEVFALAWLEALPELLVFAAAPLVVDELGATPKLL